LDENEIYEGKQNSQVKRTREEMYLHITQVGRK